MAAQSIIKYTTTKKYNKIQKAKTNHPHSLLIKCFSSVPSALYLFGYFSFCWAQIIIFCGERIPVHYLKK